MKQKKKEYNMPEIELSITTLMSLYVNSSSASDENEDIDDDIEMDDDDIAEAVMSTSDEDFEKLSIEDFEEVLGDDSEEESEDEVNEEEPEDAADDDGSEQTDDEDESETDQPSENTEELDTDDKAYNEAFDLLYGKPIRAGGRDFQIRNLDHAKNFIEMGIDYNMKMKSMKPHMRTLKTLEKQGLLDASKEDRLNLLIEIENGNKDALKRFIADSELDPLDLVDEDTLAESRKYQPSNHMISQEEIEIEEALDSISNSPSQQRTLDVMTKEMDQKSRQQISENPQYITALNQDIESGLYDQVMETVQYRRDMKQVPEGVSDIELYIDTVRNTMAPAQQEQVPTHSEPQQAQRRPANRKRKVGMSGSRSTPKKGSKREYDPLEIMTMSDDDFEKKFGAELL